jgi:hypothetical protein
MKKAVIALDNNSRRKITKRDIIVFVIIIVIAASAMIIPRFYADSTSRQAVILLDGKEVYRTDLNNVNDTTFTVPEIEGMEFEIRDGKIRVLHSDCHDKICVNTGFISSSSETIVCLPKHVVIKIENNTNSNVSFDVMV